MSSGVSIMRGDCLAIMPLFDDPAGEWRNTHPTVKPLSLMRYLVRLVTVEGALVLDPFMGSGSTLVAAKQLGRRAVGIETEERYCQLAATRLARQPNQTQAAP